MLLSCFRWLLILYLCLVLRVQAFSSTECTFETDFCDWHNLEGHWIRINAENKSEEILPPARPKSDKYYIATTNTDQRNTLTLAKPALNAERSCISFWYTLSRKKSGIEVDIVYSEESRNRVLKSSRNTERNIWQHITININPSAHYKIEINGIVRDIDEYICVDDTRVAIGTTCPADCNFDDGWCAWKSEKEEDEWIRYHSSSGQGPLSDHTNGDGYYIFNKKNGTKARLSVSQVGEGDICLTLWYYIRGDNIINIYVSTHAETKRLVHTIQSREEKWTEARIQFFQQKAYEIILEGNIEDGGSGDISIDDVTVRHGVCEQDKMKASIVIAYVVVPVTIVAIVVIGVVAYIIWRKRRKDKLPPSSKTQHLSKQSNCQTSQSFSNTAYEARISEPSKTQKSVSDDSEYAVIGDDVINMSTDKTEYNVLNAKDKDQHDKDFSYSRLKQSLTPFVNKSYSHVSHNNDGDTESNDRSACTGIPKFPFETEDDLDIDYDHAQAGAADDFRKSDGYSHLHNADGGCYDFDNDKKIRHKEAKETITADDQLTLDEEASSKSHDYYILQKEETI